MRFDDMLGTLLSQPIHSVDERIAVWRQVVDVLAQGRGYQADDRLVDAPRAADAYNFLRAIRAEIPLEVRAASCRRFGRRRLPGELVRLFAEDMPHVAAPMLAAVELAAAEWIDLLPKLNSSARNILRHRQDLDEAITLALESFGATDFLLTGPEQELEEVEPAPAEPAPPGNEPSLASLAPQPLEEPVRPSVPASEVTSELKSLPAGGAVPDMGGHDTQIRDLLRRIEAFKTRPLPPPDEVSPPPSRPLVTNAFQFETGADGIICWVDGAPREALIGETIGEAAHDSDHGVDGQAAGAFRRRAPFRDARLTIAGSGAASGEWRISAVPFFDAQLGHFRGYRGSARRPRPDETAIPPVAEAGFDLPNPDSMRQLVHELRTPLNAVVGFSEMIEQQIKGPASMVYRLRAAEIIDQSKRLLSAIDDLDLAARLGKESLLPGEEGVDAAAILARLHGDFEDVARGRSSVLVVRIARELPHVAADAATVERVLARLLAATIAISSPSERIVIDMRRDPDSAQMVRLILTRPKILTGRDERRLLDPAFNPDGESHVAPVLGLGFALRLVRSLAVAVGGSLTIEEDRFVLRLPVWDRKVEAGGAQI